jgi:hypothetical protein
MSKNRRSCDSTRLTAASSVCESSYARRLLMLLSISAVLHRVTAIFFGSGARSRFPLPACLDEQRKDNHAFASDSFNPRCRVYDLSAKR